MYDYISYYQKTSTWHLETDEKKKNYRNITGGQVLGRNPDKGITSFPPCYSQSPLQLCLEIYISSNSRKLLQFLQFSYSTLYSVHTHLHYGLRNP